MVATMPDCPVGQPVVAMSASVRSFERAPSAATTSRARISRPPASVSAATNGPAANPSTAPEMRSIPAASAAARKAAVTSSLNAI